MAGHSPRCLGLSGRRCGPESKEALHLVSAWATECGVMLGQVATANHSNEIRFFLRMSKKARFWADFPFEVTQPQACG